MSLEHASRLDGRELKPLLREPNLEMPERALFWHYPHFSTMGGRPSAAIRQGRWKLLEQFETEELALYDLDGDIGETSDLSAVHSDKVRHLHEKLVDWRRQMKAILPTRPNPNYTATKH
jgi:hypothetical protein